MTAPRWRRWTSTGFWIGMIALAFYLWRDLLTPSLPWPTTSYAPLGFTEAARVALDARAVSDRGKIPAELIRAVPETTTIFESYDSPSGLGAARSGTARLLLFGDPSGRVLALSVSQQEGFSFPRLNRIFQACVRHAKRGSPDVPASAIKADISEGGGVRTVLISLSGTLPQIP